MVYLRLIAMILLGGANVAYAQLSACSVINSSKYNGCYDVKIGNVETKNCFQSVEDVARSFGKFVQEGTCLPSQEYCYMQASSYPGLVQIAIGTTLLKGGGSIGRQAEIENQINHLVNAKACLY